MRRTGHGALPVSATVFTNTNVIPQAQASAITTAPDRPSSKGGFWTRQLKVPIALAFLVAQLAGCGNAVAGLLAVAAGIALTGAMVARIE